MNQICDCFDEYYELWNQDVYRLFFVTTGSPKAANTLTFDAFLRIGAAKDPKILKDDARFLLFSSALSLVDDYYCRKMRRQPKRNVLNNANIPFSITDELWALLHLPLKKRKAICLKNAGFSPEEIKKLGLSPESAGSTSYMEVLAPVCMTEDESLLLLDSIYERFSERSVGVENSLHAIRMGFNRTAPWLALGVLVLFGIAVAVSMKMAG